MEEIRDRKIYLPAIQRKLVWKPYQIQKLFDSIMRGYPIGTFLFWKLKGEHANNYTFYQFIQEYKERFTKNEIAPKPETRDEILGVLDGQQRLNSMYIALQGSYAYKKSRARWDNPHAFPKRSFCLNLLNIRESDDNNEKFTNCEECGFEEVPLTATKCPNCGVIFAEDSDDGTIFEFEFLTEDERKLIDKTHFWFPVKEVLLWKDMNDIDDYYDNILDKLPQLKKVLEDKEKRKLFKQNLSTLFERLIKDKLISYYEVIEPELDKIVDIFIRVNSGGTILSKTDLLFSNVVANWEEGREEVECLIESIKTKGDGFGGFNNDFVMRACLVLTDSPVLFKVKTFKKENVQKIKKEWSNIKDSIEKTVDLLAEWGFNSENLTSQMSVIPLAYFLIKKGKNYQLDKKNKEYMRKYLIYSLLKQIYGGQGDQVLTKIRDALRKEEKKDDEKCYYLKYDYFPFEELKKIELPSNKSMKITENDIENMLEYSKGAYTFMLLSLLYPNLKYGQVKFHQDHLHPAISLIKSKLIKLGIKEEKAEVWQNNKDKLSNLQLLEGVENESKNKTPLKDWVNQKVKDKQKYFIENYFPEDVDLDIINFEEFYDKRREILKNKLNEYLK